MKSRTLYGSLLWLCAAVAFAQSAPPKSFDGAVVVDSQGRAATPEPPGSAPPLIVANSTKTTATDWNAKDSGTVAIKGVNSGASQTVVLNPDASAKLGASSAGQPATIVRTGATTRTVSYSEACPAGYSGSITYDQQEIQTVTNNTWTATGPKTNYVNNCTATVATRWVAKSGSCAANYTGSRTWEAEETSSAGGPWTATGRTRNLVDTCTATVETRWVAKSGTCPAYYTGSKTWEAEEQRSGGGAWTATGRTRNMVDSCVATVETRWVAAATACPAGQTGSNTWEAEEQRSGGGSWVATGRTRNAVNTCVSAAPKMKAVLFSHNTTPTDGGDGFANIYYPGGTYYCSERDADGRDCSLGYLYTNGAPNTTQWAGFCKQGEEYVENYTPVGASRNEVMTIDEYTYICTPQ